MTNSATLQVSFTQMKDGTQADYFMLRELELKHAATLINRLVEALRRLEDSFSGYKVSRLDHSLQSGSMAERDGADDDWVVAALLHDIGDDLAPYCHDSMAAAVLGPYVREQVTWVVQHHGIFQAYYYAHHYGEDPNAREKYSEHPFYSDCVDFCEFWDQSAFDPDYKPYDIEHFIPAIQRVFSRTPWEEKNIKPGKRVPLCTQK